jgi:hypothetical protein
MQWYSRFSTTLGLALVIASASLAQQVKTDYDHNADFSKYKTYSWAQVKTANPLWVDRIKSAVDSRLAARGWTLTPSGGDAVIMAVGTTRAEKTLNTFYDGLGGGWRWGGFGQATTTTETYKVGTLVIDIFDAATKSLLWRGSSSDTLSNKASKNIKTLDKSAEKLFEHFPPEAPRS